MSSNPLSIHPCFAHYSGIVAMQKIRCGTPRHPMGKHAGTDNECVPEVGLRKICSTMFRTKTPMNSRRGYANRHSIWCDQE